MSNKARNTRLENLNFYGNKKQVSRRFKDIIDEIGERKITLADIIDPKSPKQLGLQEVLDNHDATLNDLVILQQYSRAIIDSDTRAAEFLRDTKGEKPSTTVDLNSNVNPMSNLTETELRDLISGLKHYNTKKE